MYTVKEYLTTKSKVGELNIDKATKSKVDVVPTQDVNILNRKGNNDRNVRYKINVTNSELHIKKSNIVDNISIYENKKELYKINVTISEDLKKANILELLLRTIEEVFTGENIF